MLKPTFENNIVFSRYYIVNEMRYYKSALVIYFTYLLIWYSDINTLTYLLTYPAEYWSTR